MNLERYLMIKTAKKGKSSTAEDFSTVGSGVANQVLAAGLVPLEFRKPTKDNWSPIGVKDDRSLLKKYDQAQNAGLAMAMGYGNTDRKLRQALAVGGIGLGTVGGGVGGFYGGRALADLAGLDADSEGLSRFGRYALMGGGTLGGAALGGSLASAAIGAGLGDYNTTDAILAKNIADNSEWNARKLRGEGKGMLGNALLNAKRRLGEGITLAKVNHNPVKRVPADARAYQYNY